MKKSFASLMAFLLVISLTSALTFAAPEEEKKAEMVTCPVSGKMVKKAEAVGPYNYEGTDYYFCCNGCMGKFKAGPEKYINEAKDIICGMSVDKKTTHKIVHAGKEYYFCSAQCKVAFEKDPEGYIKKMNDKCTGDCKKEGHKCCKDAGKTDCSKEKK